MALANHIHFRGLGFLGQIIPFISPWRFAAPKCGAVFLGIGSPTPDATLTLHVFTDDPTRGPAGLPGPFTSPGQ